MVSIIFNDGALEIFIITLVLIALLGSLGAFITRGADNDLSQKDGFVIIVLFWIVLSLAGSIPFYLSGMSGIDSIFESMSGITTTGATAIYNKLWIVSKSKSTKNQKILNCKYDATFKFSRHVMEYGDVLRDA